MAEQKDRPLNELLSRDMVDLYVGPDSTHWILHEKLLCYRSTFFRDIFYTRSGSHNTAFALTEDDDDAFKLFVGWLYSGAVPVPAEEQDLGQLFELYLMGEKWAIKGLMVGVLNAVRRFYSESATYPGLRRVQYVYANTKHESPMRRLLVGAVARFLVLGDGLPAHWDKALRKNGQLAVDIILAVQNWKIDESKVPDPRQAPVEPGVQTALDKGVVKKEEVEDGKLPKGVEEFKGKQGEKLPNGVNGGEHEEEEQHEEEQNGEEEKEEEEEEEEGEGEEEGEEQDDEEGEEQEEGDEQGEEEEVQDQEEMEADEE